MKLKNLIQLNDIEYRTHDAIVRVMGKTFTVPIDCNSTRAQQNAQIEKWFKTQAKAAKHELS